MSEGLRPLGRGEMERGRERGRENRGEEKEKMGFTNAIFPPFFQGFLHLITQPTSSRVFPVLLSRLQREREEGREVLPLLLFSQGSWQVPIL